MAGFVSPSTLEQIRSASDIVDVIGAYIPLKRAGANFSALCPFHKEKTPSFNVNPQRQIFHCFGCHKGGDVFTFVKEFENIPFPDAVRRLADRAKIPLEIDNQPGQQHTRHLKDTLLQIHEQITQRWQNALANEAAGQPARDYLASRNVPEDAVKLFRLGYAPADWSDTVNWAKSKGFDLAVVEQGGLILRKEPNSDPYDRFRGRLIFPICDEQGRVIGFSGRVLEKDVKAAKYVNSPETPIFTKGKVFFGLDKSKRAMLDAQSAIVCEGQLDLITCFMAGVQNIVAPQGTALTADHARILKRYVEEVVLCFDSDAAGQNAAVRSLDSLLASGLAIRVAVVPAPHDPDSLIKSSGADAFKQVIAQAEGFFDYYLGRLCRENDLSSDRGKLAVLQSMAESVHKTGNVVLIDTYAQKTALRLGVPPESVRQEFRKSAHQRRPERAPDEPDSADTAPAPAEQARPSVPEFWLMRLLLLHDDLAAKASGLLIPDWIQHSDVREIINLRLAAVDDPSGLAGLLTRCPTDSMRRLITESVANERPIPNADQQFGDILLRLRNQFIDRQLAALTHRANQPDTPDVEKLDLMRQQQELRLAKRQPLVPVSTPPPSPSISDSHSPHDPEPPDSPPPPSSDDPF